MFAASTAGRAMTIFTISLPDPFGEFVNAQVAARGHGDIGEYFLSLLREARSKEHDSRLDALLLEGLAANAAPLDSAFRQRLEVKVEQILDQHKDRTRS
jgi:antitoxin ParD1/3/4